MTPGQPPASLQGASRHWTLDPGVTFLNHGSFGATPRVVQEEQRFWRERMERQPVLFHAREIEALELEARKPLCHLLNAGLEDTVWVTNATEGVNSVLLSFPLHAGDEVLVTDHEYAAVLKTVRHATERAGAVLRTAALPFPMRSEADLLDPVLEAMNERTRLIVASHVTSRTAIVLPVDRYCREARRRGIPILVDGAHAPAMLPVDIGALGADFYAGNCHKWLCSPKGAGFLHVAPRWQDTVRPPIVSHGHYCDRTDRSPFQLAFSIQGTRDSSAFLCVPAAIQFMESLGLPEVRAWGHAMASRFRQRLAHATGLEPPVPEGDLYPMMATMPLPPGDPDRFKEALYNRYRVEIPMIDWPGRRWVRVSGAPYVTPGWIDHAVDSMARLLAEGL